MKTLAFLAILCFSLNSVLSYPAGDIDGEHDLVLSTASLPVQNDEVPSKDEPIPPLQLKMMHVHSNITNRYGHTVISSKYANPATRSQEATFSVILPDTAFITGFIMEIKGKEYKAYVEEKKEAKRIYDQAVASGIGAAHVAADARDSNRFTVSMNVEPQDKVTFNLTYEERLQRKNGKYSIVINLHPGELVKDLDVNVYINETRRLKDITTPALRSGNEIVENEKNNEFATTKVTNEDYTEALVHFAPTIEDQKKMAKQLNKHSKDENGISGQFVVEYDVERDPSGGELLVTGDGYFVHFFAPSELKPIPKHVVFVLDVSGSMIGRKIEQVKEAMTHILGELTPQDYFNLVEFSFSSKVWNLDFPEKSPIFESEGVAYGWYRPQNTQKTGNQEYPPAYPANAKYIAEAKKIIANMDADGGTNIHDSLSSAINITKKGVKTEKLPKPIIIFLTDGDATVGETRSDVIMEMVEKNNAGKNKAAIFSLAFGSDADKSFLKKLSLKNSGFMRHIYEASDASLQLRDFYKTISSPLLSEIKFKYPNVEANTLTKNSFDILFDGSEIVVSGKMSDVPKDGFNVNAITISGPIDFIPKIIECPVMKNSEIGDLERFWAYMSIKELLDKATAKDEKETPEKKRALELALKYSFVTPITSLVVVKPNETKSVETEEAHSSDRYGGYAHVSGLSGPPMFAPQASFASFPAPPVGAFGFGGSSAHSSDSLGGNAHISGSSDLRSDSFPFAPVGSFGFGGSSANSGRRGRMGGRGKARAWSISSVQLRSWQMSDEDTSGDGPIHSLAGGSFASYDRMPLTTTYRPLTTTTTRTTPKVDQQDKEVEKLLLELPWMKSFVENSNMLKLDDKLYGLGNNQTVYDKKPCSLVGSGTNGTCTLIFQCPKTYHKIPDIDTFKNYFCSLDSFAGVCCEEEEK